MDLFRKREKISEAIESVKEIVQETIHSTIFSDRLSSIIEGIDYSNVQKTNPYLLPIMVVLPIIGVAIHKKYGQQSDFARAFSRLLGVEVDKMLRDDALDMLKNEEMRARFQTDILSALDGNFSGLREHTGLNEREAKELFVATHSIATSSLVLGRLELLQREIGSIKPQIKEIHAIVTGQNIAKQPPKSAFYLGVSRVFTGRIKDRNAIKNHFEESNDPVVIMGEGGIGKTQLAYKVVGECKDDFDMILDFYFASSPSFDSFLLSLAERLSIPNDIFYGLAIEEKKRVIFESLSKFKRVLFYIDNYETITDSLDRKLSDYHEDATRIYGFLDSRVPSNTLLLLTSRSASRLVGERIWRLEGLDEEEGKDLFIKFARNNFKSNPPNAIGYALQELSKIVGGHPLSIEILARNYSGGGEEEIKIMTRTLTEGRAIKGKEERLKSLEACFDYSFYNLDKMLADLLMEIAVIFKSPFPKAAVRLILGEDASTSLAYLYERSWLQRNDLVEYGDLDNFQLYYLHPATRNYLETKAENAGVIERKYADRFLDFYDNLVSDTYNQLRKEGRALVIRRFDLIYDGKNNDLERAVKMAKGSALEAGLLNDLGLIRKDRGDFASARYYFEKALEIFKTIPRAILEEKHGSYNGISEAGILSNLGLTFSNTGDYSKAIECYKKALNLDIDSSDERGKSMDYHNIGNALVDVGKYAEALEYYKKALDLDEKDNFPHIAKIHTNMGRAFLNLGDYPRALEYYKKALDLDEKISDIVGVEKNYGNIGLTYYHMRKYVEALDYYKKAQAICEMHQIDSDLSIVYLDTGNTLLEMNDYVGALKHYEKSLEVSIKRKDVAKMVMGYYNTGLLFADIRRKPSSTDSFKAIEYLDKALELNSRYSPAWHNKGLVLYRLGKYEESINAFDESLRLDHNSGFIWIDKGNSYLSLKKYDEALRCYDEAIRLNSNYMYAWNNKGWTFNEMGEYDKAITYFDKAIEMDSKFATSWRNKGKSLMRLGKTDDSIKCYDNAIMIEPTNIIAYNDKANVLMRSEIHLDIANSLLDAALKMNPNDPLTLYNKSCVLALLGQIDDSLFYLEKAINLSDRFREKARTDKDFRSLREDHRFKGLLIKRS